MRQFSFGMQFDPTTYGPDVAALLALDTNGQRLMPLASGTCSSPRALTLLRTQTAAQLFPKSRAPEAALSGLYLYFSCLDESHKISQDIQTADGSFWHGILHRQEPDPGNAGYWFRRVGAHPIFPALRNAAQQIASNYPKAELAVPPKWDPLQFIDWCEDARQQPGSPLEKAALEIQREEWQLLFDYCACGGGA